MASNKLKTLKSTQAFSPIRDVRDGIIVTKDGRFIKLMEFSPINFLLRSNEEQATIVSQFAAALRAMPATVQFKIVTNKADVSKFVGKIREDIQTETNENCRRLQEEQINLIMDVGATQGVSRRFFLAFAYEDKGGFKKRPSFKQVVATLNQQAYAIRSAMELSGNEMLSVDNDDNYTLEALYSIMSRAQSNEYYFDDRKFEVMARYASADFIDYSKSIHIPVNDFIAPEFIDIKSSPKYMIIDDMYYMFCYLPSNAYPVQAVAGWLQVLINIGEGVDVDFFIHKEDVTTIQRKLQYKLRYNKIKMKETEDTSQDYDDLMSAIESGYYLKQGIANSDEFCYMATMLTITASNLKELNWKYEQIKTHLIKHDLKLKQCVFQQGDAFISSLPICRINPGIFKKSRRNILLSQLASSYPFVSFEMTDENGILLGANSNNGSLVFVDVFDTKKYNNANIAILGSSGSGKTYTLQCMALRMRQKKCQIFIIAPLKGYEFERACRAIGGQFIRIAPGSGQNINIMEIRKKDDQTNILIDGATSSNDSILAQKIQQLHTFFSLLVPDITFEEKQILDEALIKTYERFGITSKNKSLYDPADPTRYRKMPILGDLHKSLDNAGPEAKRLYNILSRYVSGSAASFNKPTNVNLDNKYVVLDVSTLTDEMLPIGMFIALDYVWDKARENRISRKAIFIDETWRLIGPEASVQAAEFVLEIFKVIRGYGGSAIAATQDLNDFFALDNGRFGAGIINNAKTKILMKTEPKEAEVVATAMDLTANEVEQIKKIKRGTCLLAANTNHIFIDIKASNTEHRLITTDASDLAQIAYENAATI